MSIYVAFNYFPFQLPGFSFETHVLDLHQAYNPTLHKRYIHICSQELELGGTKFCRLIKIGMKT